MEVTDEVTLSREGWGRGGVSAGVALQSGVMGGGAGPLCSWSANRWPLVPPWSGCDLPGKQRLLAEGECLQNGVYLSP